jgi:hypothetical protein
MFGVVNRLGDRMLEALLPRASAHAAAAACFCCPGGQHSHMCENSDLYELSCCCEWRRICTGCC